MLSRKIVVNYNRWEIINHRCVPARLKISAVRARLGYDLARCTRTLQALTMLENMFTSHNPIDV